jgi:hypothetical protein
MRSTLIALCPAVALLLAAPSPLRAQASAVGLFSKVIQEVNRKETGQEWAKAARGEALISGDRVRTGENSLAIIKFKDNSLLRVRAQSELAVGGTMKGRAFSKSVTVERGVVGFNIQKQQADEEFRFTSPTSVASIRGTTGAFGGDETAWRTVVLTGLVQVDNTASGKTVQVGPGFTAVALPDGTLELRASTPEEVAEATALSRTTDENRLEIDLQDPNGGKRKLKIEHRD